VTVQVPQKKLDTRMTTTVIEYFDRGKHTTAEHMPASHRNYQEWIPDHFVRWASKVGPQTATLTETILAARPHPQQVYCTLMGILHLSKSYGEKRLENACARALIIGATSFRSIDSILKNDLDQRGLPEENTSSTPVIHNNIRGSSYYHPTQEIPC